MTARILIIMYMCLFLDNCVISIRITFDISLCTCWSRFERDDYAHARRLSLLAYSYFGGISPPGHFWGILSSLFLGVSEKYIGGGGY